MGDEADGAETLADEAAAGAIVPLEGLGSLARLNSRAEVVDRLLEFERVDVNFADSMYGFTALLAASHSGHADVVERLLSAEGIKHNLASTDGWTPLKIAKHNNHTKVVELLSKHAKFCVLL